MPFFGVPIRNGLPIGLGSVAGFGVQQFDPSLLFEGGTVPGAWYDPSDLSTMFTTSAGTTPVAMPGLGAAVSVGRMLDKSGNGNHAIAINDSTARPELRARVNLLTYSEQFDNGAWVKAALTVTANSTTAPDGTITADTLVESAGSVQPVIYQLVSSLAGVVSFYVKANGRNFVQIVNSAAYANFDLSNGTVGSVSGFTNSAISSVGSGWYRISTVVPTSTVLGVALIGSGTATYRQSYTGDGTSGIYIWGADLRPANIGAAVPAYQRIADANTYDTAGFPLYLRFDGIDDGMYTPANLNLSATDKVGVFAGVRKNTTAQQMMAEFSAQVSANAGSFGVIANGWIVTGNRYGASLRANTGSNLDADTPANFAAPISNVITAQFDSAGSTSDDKIKIRLNSASQTLTFTSSTGTGNFGTYPLYIGSRGNSSLWFQGQVYGLVVVGSAVSAGNISATESWMAQKTGIVIP